MAAPCPARDRRASSHTGGEADSLDVTLGPFAPWTASRSTPGTGEARIRAARFSGFQIAFRRYLPSPQATD